MGKPLEMMEKGVETMLQGVGNGSPPSVYEGNRDFYRVRPSGRIETGSGVTPTSVPCRAAT
jgi:hypothetical protein